MYQDRMLPRAVVFALLAALAQSADRDARLVQTAQGPVRGYRTADGELFAFYSIPYATAPTGTDRFKAPLPPPAYVTPYEAVEKNIMCPQGAMFNSTENKHLQEDCLIANVFVPDTEETYLPIVVYVHGGGYQIGSGSWAKPTHLVRSKKIIAVTFNYRLGVHGFLCLGTAGAPGNAGMKDQVALLRWVNQNIASFGGNPNDVTIAGYSAGSSAVDLLQLSKITKGLFNKVIPESGANVGVWSVQIDPLENAKYFARKLNFTNVDDILALEEFYKTAPFQLLIKSEDMYERTDSTFLFSPCIERDTGVEIFLDDSPVNILKKGKYNKLPMLYGFADMEGLSYTYFGRFEMWKDRMNEKFSDFLPADLHFKNYVEREEVANEIKQFYFGDKPVSEGTIKGYIDYFTDVMFAYPTMRSVKLQVEAGNDKIYLYEYSFIDKDIPTVLASNFSGLGAEHCGQTVAVLDGLLMEGQQDENTLSERYKNMKGVMRELWTNFITTGEPVPAGSSLPAWPAAGTDGAPHMSLNETLHLRGSLIRERARFWDAIYERHYRMPVPPPPPSPYHKEL